MSKRTPPQGLAPAGLAQWHRYDEYELDAHEVRLLVEICREIDIVERLEEALKDADLLVKGSMGQDVANPLIGEVRQHRTTINTLMKSLKLPEEEEQVAAKSRSESARAAANARWRRGA